MNTPNLDDDDDLFLCAECGHGWNCYLDTGGDDRYECPVCGHDTGVEEPPYAATLADRVAKRGA